MSVNGLESTSMRMAGLASGLDTEEIVKQMSAISKGRLNQQQQKLDKLEWQQEAYREVIDKITAFKDEYFDILNRDTNLGSSALFGTREATSTNSLVDVSALSNATEANYDISQIIKKAESASIESSSRSIEGIILDFDSAVDGQEYTVNFTLDGLDKEVTFNGGADSATTEANFLAALNAEYSTSDVTFSMDGDRLVGTDGVYADMAHTYSIEATTEVESGTPEELTALGLTGTTSSAIDTKKELGDIAFATELEGNGFSFEINGEKFNFDRDTTLGVAMSTINNSDAGVKVRVDSLSGGFSLETTESGDGSTLEITQTGGNLLTALFGADKIAASTSLSSASFINDSIVGNVPADGDGFGFKDTDGDDTTIYGVSGDITNLVNKKISVTVNGESKEIALWSYNSSGVKNDFTKSSGVTYQLNSELSKYFGSDAPTFSYDMDAKTFTLETANTGDVISIDSVEDTTGGSEALLTALGFDSTNNTNEVTTAQKLFDDGASHSASISFGTGFTVNIDENSTIADLVDGSNGYMTFEDGFLTLQGVDWDNTDAEGKSFLESIFGEGYNYPGVPPTNPIATYSDTGENAIIVVNGTTITNNTNNFSIEGTSINVEKLNVGAVDVSIQTTKDSEKAVEAVKGFVEDYNALIADIYEEVKTADDSDYLPLTEEQREEMSDKEIEAWEEKAKTGLLYQDSTIYSFLTSLRSAVNGYSSSGFSLNDMGIDISSDYLDYGKLELDETKLEQAFEDNPEKIQEFFTDIDDGFATRVKDVINDAVQTSGATKGTLVMIAGVANTMTATENRISRQLEDYQDLIDTLQERYEDEQERYWDQFTTLETMMSNYNSQSEWLASQFSA